MGIPEGEHQPQSYPSKTKLQTFTKLSTERRAEPFGYAVLAPFLFYLSSWRFWK